MIQRFIILVVVLLFVAVSADAQPIPGTVLLPGVTPIVGGTNGDCEYNNNGTLAEQSCGGGSVTWPTSGGIVISNGTDIPNGLAEVDGDCVLGAGGIWTAGSCSSGSGTVTSVSVASANGFAGTVANPTTTPAITIETGVTGLLLGDGTGVSAYAGTSSAGNVLLGLSAAGAGSFLPYGLTGNSTLVETTAGGLLTASLLPAPSATTLGGVESLAAVSHKWINTISTGGVPAATQPACGDLSDAGSGCSAAASSGTVTSIATSAPLGGGTITTTGTLTCTTCVVASSPGVGIAHFAGSTQTVTSSAVNLAGADVTGQLPIGAVGSAGLSGTSPIAISSAGAISCSTCSTAAAANPTATITTSIQNGSASTFMRSDGAPAAATASSSTLGYGKCDGSTITCTSGNFVTASTTVASATCTPGSSCQPAITNLAAGTLPPGSVVTVTSQSGTTYTLASTDCMSKVLFTSGSAITVTLPNNLAVGCQVSIEQAGAGQITLSAASGATLHNAHSYTKTFGQYAVVGVTVDTNSGGTSAVYAMTGDGA